VHSAMLFTPALTTRVTESLRAEILMFDWWVRNGDRTDGNANLLWKPTESRLFVIDHNLAFDSAEAPEDFWANHIFRDAYRAWTDDFRGLMGLKMRAIMGELPRLWQELPEEWTADCDTTYAIVDTILRRYVEPSFWNRP